MAISNRNRINKALKLLSAGAVSYVERELQTVLGASRTTFRFEPAFLGRLI